MKRLSRLAVLALCSHSALAVGQELTWRQDIQPLVTQKCVACHGANAPSYEAWNLDRKGFDAKGIGPRMDNYSDLMRHVVWPATGSLARRLDDGKSTGGAPGNHYARLGDTDAERAKNLAMVKSWLGDGAWNLNRWEARDKVPAITKEQLAKIKAKY